MNDSKKEDQKTLVDLREFQIDFGIQKRIDDFVHQYYQRHGEFPAGLILGPQEVVSLGLIMAKEKNEDPNKGLPIITGIRGMPVAVSEVPGIFAQIQPNKVMYFAGLLGQKVGENAPADSSSPH